ncbi:uncharacterized protein LOC130957661 [Arachis stenosperma]|uniref:uncharacterized protein LOC130957661 n=1 Tax=Arachis stenosperma TaxID=217475 RepID=UPI0025AD769D|nr:uncharacterized protein LOC130957661 [Arachis stenosperma]
MSENVGSGTGSSLPSIPRPTPAVSRRKNATGNRSDIGWKHGIDVQGNGKKVKCNYCSKTINGGIYRFKHHLAGTKEDSKPCASVSEEVKVVMLKVYNAANYKAAGERMMETRKSLYWTPCAAHCIDLILEDFEKKLKVHETTIKKGRKITTFIYSRSMLISMLRNFTKEKDLVRPGATRFATAYLTLTCLHDNKGPLMTMFTSADWKTTKVASMPEGIRVQNMALDSRLWKNIVICLKAAALLITVLRLVDSDEKLAMGFIFEGMRNAKETIKTNFSCVKKSYEPIWEIIDGRWESQLHRPLHAAAYYLNPYYHYELNFMVDDADIKIGLYSCLKKLVPNQEERKKVGLQLPDFHYARGLFGNETAKSSRKTILSAEWWDFYGDSCPELKKFAIRVLSLTCSSSGCERNWSAFEMVHTKRRNRLHQKKMNDLVYVMYNLKLKGKQIRKTPELEFDAVHSDDEWITEDVNENITESVEHSHLPTNDNTNDDPNSNEFAIPGMNSNEFNMGEGGENEFIGDPQQNLIEEEDEHVNDDEDFVGRVEPEAKRNDVSDEDGEDDDINTCEGFKCVIQSTCCNL